MRKLSFLLCLAILTSCSSPERVAEKALNNIGNGIFASDRIGPSIEKINIFRDHGDIYSSFLMESNEAESILDQGYKKSLDVDSYFMTDILFNDCMLISKK